MTARTRKLRVDPAVVLLVVLAATGLPAIAAPPVQALDPRLEPLRPLIGRTWRGELASPDGRDRSLVVRTFEPLDGGKVIRLTKTNRDLGSSGEGFVYWDDVAGNLRFFFVNDNGVTSSGTVAAGNDTITFRGTMAWPAPPPNPNIKQAYDFRNTFVLLADGGMRDSWFQNAFGPWRPGHVIEFRAVAPDDAYPDSPPVPIAFGPLPASGTDRERTLASVQRIRDVNERYATGGLYLIRHAGDAGDLFAAENDRLQRDPWIGQPWRFCSIFATGAADSAVIGRNWDNQNVGSVIVSHYRPASGHASISFSRAIDLGFPLNVRLDEMASTPFGERLLLAPFYAYDGLNDAGLFAAVTGVGAAAVDPAAGGEPIFVSYLVRKILDACATVEEAVALAGGYIPFDLDARSLNCHFLVADASGRSAILEYRDDAWRTTLPAKPWQVMTNKLVHQAPDSLLREECGRYRTASDVLEGCGGRLDWKGGMRLLKEVAQPGTTWSAVYLPRSRQVVFTVYQDWEKLYRLGFPER